MKNEENLFNENMLYYIELNYKEVYDEAESYIINNEE